VIEAATQPAALAALLARLRHAPPPFYLHRLTDGGHTGTVALIDLALTRREEILQDQLEHLPHGTRRFADAALPIRVGVTGTGDSLLVISWSAADLFRERAAGARVLRNLGVDAGMRIANTLPGALTTPGSLLLGDVIEDLGALDVPLGSIDTDAAARSAWELVDRVHPQILVLDPSSAPRFFAAATAIARPWWQGIIWLRTGTLGWEVVSPHQGVGFTGSQRTWLAIPEATCFVAHSCAAARLHIDAGVVAEVVDETSGAVIEDDQTGTLVLTPLGLDAPVVRYASGLGARLLPPPCTCGGSGAVLQMV
jgi:phenylacetate-coenzyme A ligase PaaK-like adenylate-forming protein